LVGLGRQVDAVGGHGAGEVAGVVGEVGGEVEEVSRRVAGDVAFEPSVEVACLGVDPVMIDVPRCHGWDAGDDERRLWPEPPGLSKQRFHGVLHGLEIGTAEEVVCAAKKDERGRLGAGFVGEPLADAVERVAINAAVGKVVAADQLSPGNKPHVAIPKEEDRIGGVLVRFE